MKVFCVPGMRMVLAVKVPSSVSRDRKLWTGRSSWVRLRAACAGWTTEARSRSVEEEGGEAHLDVVGELHAEEDVGARSGRRWWMGRTLRSTEAADPGEALVPDGASGVRSGSIGAGDVDAVELFFGGDLLVDAFEGEGVLGDLGVEVLGDLVSVDDFSDADADGVLAAEGPLGPPGGLSDGFEELFGGGEEFEPLAVALGGEPRIAADDEPFAGEVVAGDFGEVALVEQGGVHRFEVS